MSGTNSGNSIKGVAPACQNARSGAEGLSHRLRLHRPEPELPAGARPRGGHRAYPRRRALSTLIAIEFTYIRETLAVCRSRVRPTPLLRGAGGATAVRSVLVVPSDRVSGWGWAGPRGVPEVCCPGACRQRRVATTPGRISSELSNRSSRPAGRTAGLF